MSDSPLPGFAVRRRALDADTCELQVFEGSLPIGGIRLRRCAAGLEVSLLKLPPHVRGKGLGARLYGLALVEARHQGLALVSDTWRSHYAEAFWRKQEAAGCARCLERGRARVWAGPLGVLRRQLQNECQRTEPAKATLCAEARFRELTARLPTPEDGVWPCFRWVMA